MPISSDPTRTVEYILELDRAKPDELRPAFICKFLTYRETIKVQEAWDKTQAAKTDAESLPHLLDAIRVGVTGWRNMKEPFNVDVLPDLLTGSELWDLAYGYVAAVRATESDLKKSAQQLRQSTADSSAADSTTPAK